MKVGKMRVFAGKCFLCWRRAKALIVTVKKSKRRRVDEAVTRFGQESGPSNCRNMSFFGWFASLCAHGGIISKYMKH